MDDAVYAQVKISIKKVLNIDLQYYKEEQMRRRLDSWLVRSKAENWKDYFAALPGDDAELERFRNYLTINVTEFFRDTARWDTVRTELLPYLIKNAAENGQSAPLKFWSAGCSIGTEAYSMAIMMDESAPRQKYSILATDLDRGALQRARERGPYSQDDIRSLSPAQRQRYITPAPYRAQEFLQKNITFREQNLITDRFEQGFDLIVCRNVVIYFTAEAKDALYAKFAAALKPGGILFVGGTEIISGASKFGLQNFGISFYKK